MKAILWASIFICVFVLVFITAVTTALILYLESLDDEIDAPEKITEKSISSMLGIETPVKKATNFMHLAVKYVNPVLTDLASIKDVASSITPVEVEKLNFTQMAAKLNHPCEEHEVSTADGYLLTIFRVKGSKDAPPVLLVHGFLDSADTFILRGAGSLVGFLAKAGHDVWVANFRGNKYSRRHLTLNPDLDNAFWDFCFHEHGSKDLPSIIDYVLLNTERKALHAISHSQGSTAFYVMSSTLPEYNSKVELLVSMAPICHLDDLQSPLSDIMFAETIISFFLRSLGKEEIFGSYSQVLPIVKRMCSFGFIGSEICLEGGLFYLFGRDAEEVKADFLPLLAAHYPAGTSIKNLNHVSQLYRSKSFSQYDYGFIQNMFVYVSLWPPTYDLKKVSMKTAMFVARNDKISTWKDVQLLRQELPNVVEHRVLRRRRFNHVDYVWGENVRNYLYPQILEVLRKYT